MQTEQKIYYISEDEEKEIRQVQIDHRSNLPKLRGKYRVNEKTKAIQRQKLQNSKVIAARAPEIDENEVEEVEE